MLSGRPLTEEARETGWDQPSFGKQLFLVTSGWI
jgi:hypothetical protein